MSTGPGDSRKEIDARITHVWREHDPMNSGRFLTKYRLVDSDGESVGVFHTPESSQLSQALHEIARGK